MAERAKFGMALVEHSGQILGGGQLTELALFSDTGTAQRGGEIESQIGGLLWLHCLVNAGSRDLGKPQRHQILSAIFVANLRTISAC